MTSSEQNTPKRRDPVPLWIMGILVILVILIVLYGPQS